MQIPCVYIPGPAPAVSVANSTVFTKDMKIHHRTVNMTLKNRSGVQFEEWPEVEGPPLLLLLLRRPCSCWKGERPVEPENMLPKGPAHLGASVYPSFIARAPERFSPAQLLQDEYSFQCQLCLSCFFSYGPASLHSAWMWFFSERNVYCLIPSIAKS